MSSIDVVLTSFDAYRAQDRAAAESVLAGDLIFTSPQDDHIDRAAYFQRCFPTADRFVSQQIVHVVEDGTENVLLVYEYELVTGEAHRNAEVITVRDGQIHEIQVFFGGRVH